MPHPESNVDRPGPYPAAGATEPAAGATEPPERARRATPARAAASRPRRRPADPPGGATATRQGRGTGSRPHATPSGAAVTAAPGGRTSRAPTAAIGTAPALAGNDPAGRDARQADITAFGARIRELRAAAKLTQQQLADATGIHRAVITDIERGRREIGVSRVRLLAEALRVKPGSLFLPARGDGSPRAKTD